MKAFLNTRGVGAGTIFCSGFALVPLSCTGFGRAKVWAGAEGWGWKWGITEASQGPAWGRVVRMRLGLWPEAVCVMTDDCKVLLNPNLGVSAEGNEAWVTPPAPFWGTAVGWTVWGEGEGGAGTLAASAAQGTEGTNGGNTGKNVCWFARGVCDLNSAVCPKALTALEQFLLLVFERAGVTGGGIGSWLRLAEEIGDVRMEV